jgi:two-component system, OmpR family, sensor histidine kinase VicK
MDEKNVLTFLQGGGEMGELIRNFNWKDNPVGSPGTWPQSLRTVLSIVVNSKFPMFLWWGKDLIQFYNDAYRPSFGFGEESRHPHALGQKGELCWTDEWPFIKSLIDDVLSGKGAIWREDQMIPIFRNGRMEDVFWTFGYSAVNDESGKISGVLVVCNETTQKVKALKALQRTEKTIRNLFIQAPVAVAVLKGEDMLVEFANDRMFQLWGRSAEDLSGKAIFEGLPEAKGQGIEELLDDVYQTGKSYSAVELPVNLSRQNLPEKVYINLLCEPFREADGTISGIIAVAIDVSEQVRAHKKIEEAEEKTRRAIESAELGLYEIDPLSGEMVTNEWFKNITGFAPVASRFDFMSIIYPDDLPVFEKAYNEVPGTGQLSFDVRIMLRDETIRWINATGKLIRDENGLPLKIYGLVKDMTSIKEIERQKDDFIGIVSHELKTPLTFMKVATYLLTDTLNKDKESAEVLLRMENQIDRVIRILHDLREVTRIESDKIIFHKDNFDFGELVIEICREVEIAKKSHQILINHVEHVTLTADKTRISQVLINLLTNAMRYSPNANSVIVSVRREKNEVICSVKDFGNGIPIDQQKRIFERFYQTAKNSRGNSGFGLGLYISSEIIKRQQGRIWLECEEGQGCTFYFSLPVI